MPKPLKPLALVPGSTIAVVAPASTAKAERILRGCENLGQLDYRVTQSVTTREPDGYFSASVDIRLAELQDAFTRKEVRGVFCSRGGYGSAELVDKLKTAKMEHPKIFLRFQ